MFDDDFEFPWNNSIYNGDYIEWWIYDICQYKLVFEIWNKYGEYIDGIIPSDKKISGYFTLQYVFEREHHFPVELVNYCSDK